MEKIKNHYTTIFDQIFSPNGKLLTVATNFGEIGIFKLSPFLNLDDESLFQIDPQFYHPAFRFKGQSNCLYSLAKTKDFLIGGGVGMIEAWRWEDLKSNESKSAWSIPLQHGDNLLRPEVNSLLLDGKNSEPRLLYGACGDNNIHCWDLETRQISKTFQGHSDYIHDIAISTSGNELYSGSEDGSVKIWDSRKPQKAVQTIEPYKLEKLHQPKFGKWIGALDLDPNDDWLACGGGPLLSTWHLRTLTCSVVFPVENSTVTRVIFHEDSILSAGSESFLNHWDFSGSIKSKIPTSAIGVFSVAINNGSNKMMLSIGGRGPLIDICTNIAYKDYTLDFNPAE